MTDCIPLLYKLTGFYSTTHHYVKIVTSYPIKWFIPRFLTYCAPITAVGGPYGSLLTIMSRL